MVADRIDPSDEIPEADLLEQHAEAAAPPLSDAEDTDVAADAPAEPVDEADRSEQHAPVPAAEDDYPHELDQPGWS